MGLKSGKYNKKRWVPLRAAKILIAEIGGITSRSKYWKWHKKNKPLHLPRYPNRTYPDWVSWNDFLHVDNSFEKELNRKRMITRPYWEAVRWVQAQRYETADDYKQHYEAGDVPVDIPKAPNQFYPEWSGWGIWLGSNVRSYIMSKTENLNMLALCKVGNQAENLIEVVTCPDGVVALQQIIAERTELAPYKVYHVGDGEDKSVMEILKRVASSQGCNQYICVSIHDLHFELDNLLEKYVPGK